jgi:23S rRNA pseudouridine2605 synthase
MEAIGLTVNRLIRVSYGPFQLGSLTPGAVEELRPRVVRDQLGLDAETTPRRSPKRPARRAGAGKTRPD